MSHFDFPDHFRKKVLYKIFLYVKRPKDTKTFECQARQQSEDVIANHSLEIRPLELASPSLVTEKPMTTDGKTVYLQWQPVQHASSYVLHLKIDSKDSKGKYDLPNLLNYLKIKVKIKVKMIHVYYK